MSETVALVDALKRVLRSQKITYADLAKQLDLSESSVKRCFAQHQFTLERFEQICQIAGVQVAELAALAAGGREAITQLTEEQEEELVRDEKLLLTTMLVLNHWTSAEICDYYLIEENELLRRLLKLDQLKMIELLPGNRIRAKVGRHFSWRADGPVQQYFARHMRDDFMNNDFSDELAHKRFMGALLSGPSLVVMRRAIDQLVVKLDELIQADTVLPLEEKYGVAAMFAIRPWEVPAFRAMRRHPERHYQCD